MWNNAYLESQILTADSLGLVQILYQGAIQAVRDAREHLAKKDIRARSAAISKAASFILELTASLDVANGGVIASNLGRLYQYMQERLVEANIKQTDGPLAETLGLLTTLSEAWQSVGGAAESSTDPASHQPGTVPAAAWETSFTEDPAASSQMSQSWTL
ncbi:MAG: flagellar export chaperone FliS [Bryobacteraceae bacterium]